MKRINITSKLFGNLSFANKDGLMKDFQININGKDLFTTLYIVEECISEDNINQAVQFLDHIPNMYETAKDFIMKNTNNHEVEAYFLESSMDEMDEDDLIDILGIDDAEEISKDLIAQRLEPRTMRISSAKAGDGKIDFNFDFSLPEEYTDELLVIYFNADYEIYEISHES